MRLCESSMILASAWAVMFLAQAPKPPSASIQKKLATAYLAADARSTAGRQEQLAILAKLASVPPLRRSAALAWKKKLLALAAKAGPKLKKKSGRAWFWHKPQKRGLYIVGGRTRRPKGLLIGMHGGGKGAGDAGASHGAFQAAASKLGWVAVFPQVLKKTEHGWTDSGTEEFVLDLVAAARRTWKIDPNRVFFAGHSMGGYGSWTLGAHHADVVAAIAPSAGAPTPVLSRETQQIVDIEAGVVPSLRNVPMIIYQSGDDPQVPPEVNRFAVKALARAKKKWGGFPFEYWEVDGRGHALPPGGTAALLAKIAKRVRNPVPEKIVWQPKLAWKRQFYWLHWEKPIAGAIVVARLDKQGNRVLVECDKPAAGLSVLLDRRLVDMDQEVYVELNGKEVFRGKPRATLPTLLLTAARNDADLVFEARVPLR